MRKLVPTQRLAVLTTLLILLLFVTLSPQRKKDLLNELASPSVAAQTRERKVNNSTLEVVKVDVDLVTVDALVLQKDTARVVGDLKREDFQIFEDGKPQEITHFSQNSLPLSVLLMIDRGGCLDAYSWEVRNAAIQAVARLKPTDEVAVMSYHNTTEMLQEFTRDRSLVARALNRVPPHDEAANHCINKAFFDAANYMESAGNPVGRRVVIFITGVTRNFDCDNGPGAKQAIHAIYESGSVVCGLVPVTPEQVVENGAMRWATRMGGMFKLSTLNIKQIAEDTGGEVLSDKPEVLDQTFVTLMEHLRSRFSLAFVSSNKARDGSLRKLKIDLTQDAVKSRGKLVVKSRRSYVAPRS
jgi:Ca-activated chloride channel family protein